MTPTAQRHLTAFLTALWHRLAHWTGRNGIEVVSAWDGPHLYIGAKCVTCGKESGWHKSRVTRPCHHMFSWNKYARRYECERCAELMPRDWVLRNVP